MEALARNSDPTTSHVAASMAAGFAASHRSRILAKLQEGPRTIHELAWDIDEPGLDHVAVARRMSELERAGKAEPTEETRPSPSGRPARVWKVTP